MTQISKKHIQIIIRDKYKKQKQAEYKIINDQIKNYTDDELQAIYKEIMEQEEADKIEADKNEADRIEADKIEADKNEADKFKAIHKKTRK